MAGLNYQEGPDDLALSRVVLYSAQMPLGLELRPALSGSLIRLSRRRGRHDYVPRRGAVAKNWSSFCFQQPSVLEVLHITRPPHEPTMTHRRPILSHLRHPRLCSFSSAAASCPAVIHAVTIVWMMLLHCSCRCSRSALRGPSSFLAANSSHWAPDEDEEDEDDDNAFL